MRLKVIQVLLSLMIAAYSSAQNDLAKAGSLAREGKFNEAIKTYSEILKANENNTAARLGRGFTYSWMHDFANAKADFNKVLSKDAANMEAQKGLAYTELWSGDLKNAIRSFNTLIDKETGMKDFYIARGQALMNNGQHAEARQSFEKAKQLDPSDKEAQQLIIAVRNKPTILDIDIIGGFSETGSESTRGLRLLQLSSQVSPKIQLFAKYDNSLSIDNLGLILRNQAIPYYAGNVLYKWNNNTLTRLEGGARNYKDAKSGELERELQFGLEQVVFLSKNRSVKAGVTIITPNVGESAYLLLAGYRQALGKKVTGGITYFYANRNVKSTFENRLLADADFMLTNGKSLNTGFYYCISGSDDKTMQGSVYGAFIRGYFPLNNILGLHLGVAAEKNFLQDLFNINGGIRFRLEK